MVRKDYKLVWGLALLIIGCVAASSPPDSTETECSEGFVKNEAGECIDKSVHELKEFRQDYGDQVVGELSRLVANLPVVRIQR